MVYPVLLATHISLFQHTVVEGGRYGGWNIFTFSIPPLILSHIEHCQYQVGTLNSQNVYERIIIDLNFGAN